jgi:hypothetical protein
MFLKHYSTMKNTSSLILLFAIYTYCYSQKAPAKYGDIDKADLEMKVYPADSSAPAVILCDYGYFDATRFQFTRLLRIKILKKEGYKWANQICSFRFEKPGIKGTTYNLENGVITSSKLKPESIFTETVKAQEYYRTRFAMPNVKEGSVMDIEIYYTGLPYEWRFQDLIPIRWSELIIEPTPVITFHNTFFGIEPLALETDRRWVGVNMPAFKEEPYTDCINNYIRRTEIEISEMNVPSKNFHLANYYENHSSNWQAVNKVLLRYDAYNNGLGVTNFLNGLTEEIKNLGQSKEEMLKVALEKVKKIKWNDECSIYTSHQTLHDASKKGTGNVADINLTLFQLLKKLDFETHPIVLRTRNEGKLSATVPSLDKLNYVVVQVKINDKTYLLDATEELLPYDFLPERCMNGDGRTVCRPGEWINLRSSKKDREITNYDLILSTDNLSLNGKMVYKRSDYAAYNFRKNYRTFNSRNEYLDDFKKDKPGLTILNSEIQKLDSIYFSIQDQYQVTINNKVIESAGELYLNPLLYSQIQENPFKSDERNYPVDFPYLVDRSFSGTIKVPENYTVISLPAAVKLQLPNNAATLIYQVAFVNNTIQFSCKLNINKEIFLSEEYADLKEFYAQIIKKQEEPVILKKK